MITSRFAVEHPHGSFQINCIYGTRLGPGSKKVFSENHEYNRPWAFLADGGFNGRFVFWPGLPFHHLVFSLVLYRFCSEPFSFATLLLQDMEKMKSGGIRYYVSFAWVMEYQERIYLQSYKYLEAI